MKYKLVLIEWADAVSSVSWYTKEELFDWEKGKNHLCNLVGWLVGKNRHFTIIAGEIDQGETTQFSQISKIPNGMIQKIKTLKE